MGRIGPGHGGRTGFGTCGSLCTGSGLRHGRGTTIPRVQVGSPVGVPDMDKEIIRRYIRQKLPEFQHCYERRLIVVRALEGTVTLQFTIAATGQVTASAASGLDPDVDACSAGVVRSIQFPRFPSGGVVNVSRYPLTFHATE